MLVTIIFILFIYFFSNIYVFLRSRSYTYRYKIVRITIISLHLLLLLFIGGILIFFGKPHLNYQLFSFYFQVNFVFLLISILILLLFIFYILGDLLIFSAFRKFNQGGKIQLRRGLHKTALLITFLLWSVLFYGYFYGVTNYKVRTYDLNFNNLPQAFHGVKIVHFSDTHLGSFCKQASVEKGIQLIIEQHPDLLLFTGDLVNISADEAAPYIELFASIDAPLGKFAILGNHDMSDYMKMDIKRDSMNVNTHEIIRTLESMGFTVLRDTTVFIYKDNDSIQIAGTYNWGKPPFRAYSSPEYVLRQIQKENFTILLSHDPSFWNEHVNDQTNIELTLSGHTHGMQLGIRTERINWSAASVKYKTWGGIYRHGEQILHVNPGFGFIGMPFRVGVFPEITVFRLNN